MSLPSAGRRSLSVSSKSKPANFAGAPPGGQDMPPKQLTRRLPSPRHGAGSRIGRERGGRFGFGGRSSMTGLVKRGGTVSAVGGPGGSDNEVVAAGVAMGTGAVTDAGVAAGMGAGADEYGGAGADAGAGASAGVGAGVGPGAGAGASAGASAGAGDWSCLMSGWFAG